MKTSLEEGIKLHRFAGIFPEQLLTEAGRYCEAVVAADQRMVIRCYGDDLAGFVQDVSQVPPPIQRAGHVDASSDEEGDQMAVKTVLGKMSCAILGGKRRR